MWALQLLKFTELIGWHDKDRPFAVIGHSMGQEIACIIAGAFSAKLSSVVMIDGCGPWVSLEADANAAKDFRWCANDWMKRDRRVPTPRSYDTVEELIEARMKNKFSPAGMSRHTAAAIVRRSVKAVEGKYQYSHDPRAAVAEFQGSTEEQALEFLAEMPRTLCIMASNGLEGGPRTFVKRRQHIFRDLTIEWMEGGHHLHLDTPAPTAALITAFLQPVMLEDAASLEAGEQQQAKSML
jgi:pimeloyl-ACP methyl ester carboxylesterase